MSSERTLEDVWADQVRMAARSGREATTGVDPETAAILRELGVVWWEAHGFAASPAVPGFCSVCGRLEAEHVPAGGEEVGDAR